MTTFALCCMVFAAGCFIGWILKWCAVSDQMGELKKTHAAELRKAAGFCRITDHARGLGLLQTTITTGCPKCGSHE